MEATERVLSESARLRATRPKTKSAQDIKEPWLKRPLDLLLSATMLILSAPVFLPITLAIKLEDSGPVFYLQELWGRSTEAPLPISALGYFG